LVLGRRVHGFSERLPSQLQVTLPLPVRIEGGMCGAGGRLFAVRPSNACSATAVGRVPIQGVTDRKARHVLRSYRLWPARFRYANRH
ncbi:MAG: hypothetical protein ABR903_09975, partial [Thermodesulfovibrionales bacterium]